MRVLPMGRVEIEYHSLTGRCRSEEPLSHGIMQYC